MKLRRIAVLMLAVLMVSGLFAGATTAQAAKKSYTQKELKMLSAIIFCEAGGQSYAGKLAVGCVVMNRKRSKSFPNTVEGVIKQPYQFGPVSSGKWRAEMKKYKAGSYNSGARKQCKKAAKAALEGQTYVRTRGKKINMRRYHFFNGYLGNAKLRIGGHDFK